VFPTNSAFGQPLPEKPELLKDIPVRHVGRPNTVEIPLSILSQWIDTLEDASDAPGMEVLSDTLFQMRSYLRG
jgi:hypothetical protein